MVKCNEREKKRKGNERNIVDNIILAIENDRGRHEWKEREGVTVDVKFRVVN